jgi:hypothetical protein
MITLMSIVESQRLLTQVREENVGGESYGQALQRLFIVMPLAPVSAPLLRKLCKRLALLAMTPTNAWVRS